MPHTSPVPTRNTSEADLNRYNVYLRSLPWYQQFFTQRGLNPNRVKLSRSQQGDLERLMSRNGVRVPGGMHIDQAGNLNQKNRLARNAAITGAAAAATAFGVPGLFPGLLNSGAAALPTLASTPIGTGLGFGPASLAGTSALGVGTGAGTLAASAGIPALTSMTGAPIVAGGTPTLASRAIGPGFGTGPASLAGTSAALGNGARNVRNVAEGATRGLGNQLLSAGITGLAGLTGLVGNRGPTAEEQQLQQQVLRLLAQQEARTTAQDPLFQDVTALTRSLLPRRS